jgi:hypothetical protein
MKKWPQSRVSSGSAPDVSQSPAFLPTPAWRRNLRSVALLVAIALAIGPNGASAQVDADALWSDRFTAPGFDNVIRALAAYDGGVVAAGDFLQTPDGRAEHIALWNGTEWTPLGEGLALPVGALLVHDGALIASTVNAFPAYAPVVSRWDGAHWTRMDAGLARCEIAALAVYQDQLVACGDLGVEDTLPGRFPAARWDGTTWRQMGPDAYRYKGMKAMTVHEGQLVIGGRPTTMADMTAALVLRWSGTAWDTLGVGARSDEVHALVSRDGALYAAGTLDGLVGGPVARWDGATWRRLAPFRGGVVRTLRIDGDAIVAGGRFTLDDGSVQSVVRWNEAGTGTFASLNGLVTATASFGQRLVAAGGDLSAGPVAEPVALSCAEWVEGAWMPLGGQAAGCGLIAPRGGSVYAFRSEGDTLIAGGRFEFARDGRRWVPMANVARWDGAHWSALGSEIVGSVYTLGRYRGELIAAGAFQGGSGDERIENIARWDGARWRPFGGGIHGIGVTALLAAGDSLVAAGLFGRAGGVSVGDIARWNGDSWAPLGPVYNVGTWDYSSITALAVHDGALISVSSGSSLTGDFPFVSRWDGAAWQQMNAGLPFSVTVLGTYQGQLVAAGRGGLARWDGSQWSPLAGAPLNISALEPDGDTLVCGGSVRGRGRHSLAGDHAVDGIGMAGPRIGSRARGSQCDGALPGRVVRRRNDVDGRRETVHVRCPLG